jgi:hypothetical protein
MAEYKVLAKEVTSVVWRDVQKAAVDLSAEATPPDVVRLGTPGRDCERRGGRGGVPVAGAGLSAD